jgi:rRNA maturation RNase YbeY
MRRLNRLYRGKDRPTDVLAFPIWTPTRAKGSGTIGAQRPTGRSDQWFLTPYRLLGDVVVSVPAAARQARARRHPLSVEMTVLLIHGVLHLLGYDHERGEQEARRMSRQEQKILKTLHPLPKILG